MINLKLVFLFVFLNIFSISRSSDFQLYTNFPSDTINIISYQDKLGLYFYSIRKFRTYELKNSNLGIKLKYEPNGQFNMGMGFNYKWMGIGLAVGIPFLNKDNAVYGETKRLDLQLNLYSRFFGINTYYQKYQGFYLSNPDDFLAWNQRNYPLLGNMECTSMGISAFYWLNNKKFSYKAAYVRNEVQKKSAGGFVLGLFVDADVLYSPSGFIPSELPDSLSKTIDFKGYSTFIAGISLGYAYTLVLFKKSFINFSVLPGIGYRNLTIWYVISDDKTDPDIAGCLKARFSLGYEGKHFYLGGSAAAGLESFKYEEVNISSTSGQIRFYIGKRF
jgi:hypothetical protein